MRRLKLTLALLIACGALASLLNVLPRAQVAAAPAEPPARGPYLGNQTLTSVQVIWLTAVPTDTVLRYGVDSTILSYEVSDAALVTTHVVTLTNLQPGTLYFYAVWSSAAPEPLAGGSFRTNRPQWDPYFTFAALGDSGTGSTNQYDVAALLQRIQPNLVIHTGDVVYSNGQWSGFDPYFFSPYSQTLKSVPFFTSMGNHDHETEDGRPYLENFYLPSNNPDGIENYYSFDYGNAHFVALDTGFGGASLTMTTWLSADLAATTKFWKFVYFHHAIYTSGAHGLDGYITPLRYALAPIFEQHNVDIVFMGHDHTYERSIALRDFVPESRGVRYIVTGGGGAFLYPRLITDGYWTEAFYSTPDFWHAVKVNIANCALTLQAITPPNDIVFDSLTLDRCYYHFLPAVLR